jgi:hypothetical protein
MSFGWFQRCRSNGAWSDRSVAHGHERLSLDGWGKLGVNGSHGDSGL